MNTPQSWLKPDWPVSDRVIAYTTSRCSLEETALLNEQSGYQSFNLALHVDDDTKTVEQNRLKLASLNSLPPNHFHWLEQIHSNTIVKAEYATRNTKADASYTNDTQQACVVMTADCLPVLFCNRQETQIAAAHAGWRGLAAGILRNTVQTFDNPHDVIAWLGPAISQHAFEVGEEVYQTFCEQHPEASESFFPGNQTGKWYADLYKLARLELSALGVTQIYGGGHCTFKEAERFYSYRRDGKQSGRMASVIYIR